MTVQQEKEELAIVFKGHYYRMLAAGVALVDWNGLAERSLEGWMDWYGYWMERGEAYETLGDAAFQAAHRVTAAGHWVSAAMCYHFAQFMLYGYPDPKKAAEDRRASVYRKAAPWLGPPAEPLAVSFPPLGVPAYFRKPPGQGPFPVVIIVPGLEATKEEMHGWEGYFLNRGLATCAMDGPGQGELTSVPLTMDAHSGAVSAVISTLQARDDVRADRIGIMGVSLGGLLASRAAALDARIFAAAEIGGTFDTESRWDRANALSKRGHVRITQAADETETRAIIQTWTMEPVVDRIHVPFLVAHGENDRIVPVDQAYMFKARIPGAEFVVVEGGNHVCNNMPHRMRPLVADWFGDRLLDTTHGGSAS